MAFASALRAELEAITEEGQGIREVLLAHEAEVNAVPIDDPIVRVDINTAEDYEKALARYGT